jgi:hypothetical protein
MAMPKSPRYTFDISEHEPSRYPEPIQLTENEIRYGSYFITSRFLRNLGNWRHLAGILICAFMLNAAMVSLGADNYRVLAQTWDFSSSHANTTSLPAWSDGRNESAIVGKDIYGVLFDFSLHSIFTQSIASVIGSLALVVIQRWLMRRSVLVYCSLTLATLFTIIATISLPTTLSTAKRGVIIAMTILSYCTFSLGYSLVDEFRMNVTD